MLGYVRKVKPKPTVNNYFLSVIMSETKHIYHWIVTLIFIYWLLYALFICSYASQTTFLSDYFPSNRLNCPILTSKNYEHSKVPIIPLKNKLKIGLLCVFENVKPGTKGNSHWDEELFQRILKNRDYYVKKYNYDLIVTPSNLIDHTKPIAWSKLLAIKYYLKYYDYLFYIDMDTVILNMDIKLEDIIEYGQVMSINKIISQTSYLSNRIHDKSNITIHNHNHNHIHVDNNNNVWKDFIITNDHNGLNTGIFLIKNSSFSFWFVNEAFKQNQLVGPISHPSGISHPFEYEQRAFHYLIDSKIWADRKLPKYHGKI